MDFIDQARIRNAGFLDRELEALKGRRLYLYGAGGFGKEMCAFLAERSIPIAGFLDRAAPRRRQCRGHPVFLPEEVENRQEALVLFSIVMDREERREVLRQLGAVGFGEIREAQYYRSMQAIPAQTVLQDLWRQDQGRIAEAYSALGDSKSRQIYAANLQAHFTGNYEACGRMEDPLAEQYFPEDVPLRRGYGRFIDCGGFVGDTIARLLAERGEEVRAVAAFEPNLENFARMSAQAAAVRESFCYPCAVSSETAFRRFRMGYGSGALADSGAETALTVSLDAALKGFHPTFLKMDIEGAEPLALAGARALITADTPDLAICVYHQLNHLWEIPLQIKSWNLGYRFYLRSYNAYTMETVLYATTGGPSE